MEQPNSTPDTSIADTTLVEPAILYVVDDDDAVRAALGRLLSAGGYRVAAFQSAETFLVQHDPHAHGCIVLDVAMPGLDGLALQQLLAERGSHMPVIFLTGRADVPMTVRAMKRGAFDFLTKPVDGDELFPAVARALERDLALRRADAARAATESRLSTLTAREREVLTHVMAGRLNKQIAADLGTVEKTVKVHRGRVMEKLKARSLADLVRLAGQLGVAPAARGR